MKKLLLTRVISVFVLFVLIGCEQQEPSPIVNATLPEKPMPEKTDTQLIKTLAETVRLENEKLPVMIDKQTRLDKMVAGPGAQLTYMYTLPNHAAIDISREWIISDVKPQVAKDACGNKELSELLRKGVSIVYVYKGKDGIEINQFSVKQGDCL